MDFEIIWDMAVSENGGYTIGTNNGIHQLINMEFHGI